MCTDPRDVASVADAFDLATTAIHTWELHLIWAAIDLGIMRISGHAHEAAMDESVPTPAVLRVILQGVPRSKDIGQAANRFIGINFEGRIRGGRSIRVKVSWLRGYVVVTVHAL
jgi:hypothetical protein